MYTFPDSPTFSVKALEYSFGGGTFDDPPIFRLDLSLMSSSGLSLAEWVTAYEKFIKNIRDKFDANMSGPPVTVSRVYIGTAYQDDGNATL
jgi:hypothetical protein